MNTETAQAEDAPAPVENVIQNAPPEGLPQTEAAPVAEVKPEVQQEPKGVAKRIKELTDARRAAEAREARLLALLEQRTAPPQATSEAEKGLADFGYDEKKFSAYVTERTAKQAAEAARKEFESVREAESAAARRAVFEARADAFADTVEDYREVLEGEWACSKPMAEVIEESDEGPALAYYLAQNPDQAAKLAKLSAAKAGVELAKLETKLVSERKKAAEAAVSKTKPPPPKIDASGDPGASVDPTSPESDKLSDEEWIRRREKQLQRRRT